MDDNPAVMLKKICCICLTRNRKLFQLCSLKDGVDNFYFLLSHDAEAYKEGFYKDATSLHICCECKALMRKTVGFRQTACAAQKPLSCIADGLTNLKDVTSLSKLSIVQKSTIDLTVSHTEEMVDNFIDCSAVAIKVEDDIDDVPLSELHCAILDGKDVDISITALEKESLVFDICHDTNEDSGSECNTQMLSRKKAKRIKSKEISITRRTTRRLLENKKSKALNDKGVLESGENAESDVVLTTAQEKCDLCILELQKNNHLEQQDHCFHVETKTTSVVMPLRGQVMRDKRTASGYKCSECSKYFENKNQRWKHTQRMHREGYRCHACGKRFAFKNNLSRHEKLHEAPLPREECAVCHKMIRTDLSKAHARIHSERPRYSCAACDKTFVSRASYTSHLKYANSHASQPIFKYKCSECEKGYRSRGELRDHENYQHKGHTQHQCPVCGKALATRRCIRRHVRRAHEGIKENTRDKICQQCGKAFRDKKSLREHEYTHTGERPLWCDVCNASFRQSASLYTHRKRVHNIHTPRKEVQLIDTS